MSVLLPLLLQPQLPYERARCGHGTDVTQNEGEKLRLARRRTETCRHYSEFIWCRAKDRASGTIQGCERLDRETNGALRNGCPVSKLCFFVQVCCTLHGDSFFATTSGTVHRAGNDPPPPKNQATTPPHKNATGTACPEICCKKPRCWKRSARRCRAQFLTPPSPRSVRAEGPGPAAAAGARWERARLEGRR